jgi:hypothetical protein
MRGRRVLCAVAAVVVVAACGASAWASAPRRENVVAARDLAALPDLTAIGLTADDGYVVFSQYDVVPDEWSLMVWHDGAVSALPVAPRAVPFDASAGSDGAGRPVVVYSRCTQEPSGAGQPLATGVYLNWAHARGCQIYELALDGGQPHRLDALYDADASDSTPAIWHGEIAFARIDAGASPRIAQIELWRPGVGLETLAGGQSPCEPPGGCRHTKYSVHVVGLGGPRAYVSAMTLDGDIVGFDWTAVGPNVEDLESVTELVVDQLDGGPQQIADTSLAGGTGGFVDVTSPSAVGDSLLYLWQSGLVTSFDHSRIVSFDPVDQSWLASPPTSGTGTPNAAIAASGRTVYSIAYTPNPGGTMTGLFPYYLPGICSAEGSEGSSGGTCALHATEHVQLSPWRHRYANCPSPITFSAPGTTCVSATKRMVTRQP